MLILLIKLHILCIFEIFDTPLTHFHQGLHEYWDARSHHKYVGIIDNINYLQSTKDVQLNAFYIRGYTDAENLVSSDEEGLMRAARQDYAFFAGQRSARSTLRFVTNLKV